MELPDLNRDVIDWNHTTIITFNPDKHGYMNGYENPEEAPYYTADYYTYRK